LLQNIGVIYASTSLGQDGHKLLNTALATLLEAENEHNPATVLWSLRYAQHGLPPHAAQPNPSVSAPRLSPSPSSPAGSSILMCPPPSLDLAFDDSLIEDVREKWRTIMGDEAVEEDFMRFEEREGVGEEVSDQE